MSSTLAAKLLALHELHARGLLTDDEFARAKAAEIARSSAAPVRAAGQQAAPPPPGASVPPPVKTLNPTIPGIGLALGGL